MMKLAITVLLALCAVANGEFNECLGVEVAHLPTIKRCTQLYEACEAGVSKLNDQLNQPMGNLFHPVSLISATKSKSKVTNHTTVALLVQLAPIAHCEYTKDKASTHVSSEKCTFDMGKVEVYSLLLKQDKAPKWSLDGYKHHALSAEERNQIVAEYKTGKFYGSNLAIGIFDSSSVLPAGSVSDSSSKTFTRSPLAVFAVLASATVSIGLLFHQRRRLHNGYAPISKRGQVQGKQHDTNQHYTDPLRVHKTGEEVSLKQDTNERFAV